MPPAAACVCVCVCVSCSNSTTFRTRFWRRLAASWQSVCVENAAALVVQRIETLTLTPTPKAVAILEHSLCVTVQFNTCVTDCVWASICVCSLSLSQCVCAFSLSVCVCVGVVPSSIVVVVVGNEVVIAGVFPFHSFSLRRVLAACESAGNPGQVQSQRVEQLSE